MKATTSQISSQKKFKCKYCGRADFKKVTELATHVRLAHRDERMKTIVADAQPRVNNHNERTPQPVTEEGERLTKNSLLKKFPGYFKRIHNLGGCRVAFAQFPQWKAKLMARGEAMQTVYDALTMYRKSIGAIAPLTPGLQAANEVRIKTSTGEDVDLLAMAQQEKPKRGKKKRMQWSKEQYDLAKAILDDPRWRIGDGRGVNWGAVFHEHPEWEKLLAYDNHSSQFNSFIIRVKRGGGERAKSTMSMVPLDPLAAEPVATNGTQGVLINGKTYGLTDLERILKHYRELRYHLKACPECGYNLKEHTHCYNIVRRHMETARIEEEI